VLIGAEGPKPEKAPSAGPSSSSSPRDTTAAESVRVDEDTASADPAGDLPAEEAESGGDEPEAGAEADAGAVRPGRRRRRRLLVAGAVVVAVVVAAAGFFVLRGDSPQSDFVTYRSAAGGYKISYPRTWTRIPEPGVSLLASAGGDNAMSLRVLRLQSPVDSNNVADVKAVTDAILSAPNVKLTVLDASKVNVAGIGGYYYLYTFPLGQQQGIHAHYFLFQGRKLTIIVFQAGSLDELRRLVPVFRRVTSSLRSNPAILGPPTPAPPPVSSPPPSVPPASGSTPSPDTTPGTVPPAPVATP